MDMDTIATFIAVVRAGSFTKASEDLNISQSSVSKHVKSLEDEYGVRLLRREQGKITLTEAGETFHQRASEILFQSKELKSAMNEFKLNRKTVTVSSRYPAANYGFIRKINQFQKDYPEIYVNLIEYDQACIPNLRSKRCDLAIFGDQDLTIAEGEPAIEYAYLMHDRYIAVLHKDHALAGSEVLDLATLLKQRLYVLQQHKLLNVLPLHKDHMPLDTEAFMNIPPIVERLGDCRGISVLPEKALLYFEPKDIITLQIAGLEYYNVYIGWLKDRRNVERIKNLLGYFIEEAGAAFTNA